MKRLRSPARIVLPLALFAFAAPPALADGLNPGSLLLFPVHRSGQDYFTVISVSNTNLVPSTPLSLGGSTNVHFEYVNTVPNPNDPFRPLGCTVMDRVELLTPADTLSVLTTCHNATTPQGQEGYLVVTAEDPSQFKVPWRHDYLIGSEFVVNASGVSYSVNAIPFGARGPKGAPTDLNANGKRDFDGAEYEPMPDVLYLDTFIAQPASRLTLLNLTGALGDVNTVAFNIWNDNEFPLSDTLKFSCWFDQPLTNVSPVFSAAFLQGTPNDPSELDLNCDGNNDVETGWVQIDSTRVETAGGTTVSGDGVLLGLSSSALLRYGGARRLWESVSRQFNGSFATP